MTNATLRFWVALRMAWVLVVSIGTSYRCGAQTQDEYFESKIRPLFVQHCYECHSGQKTEGGLALDTKNGWEQGGESGPAIVPFRAEESLLIRAVLHDGLEMPPGKQLQDREVEALKEWIRSGALDPRVGASKIGGMRLDEAQSWWAFQPLPAVALSLEPSEIDRRIDEGIERNQLASSPRADSRALVRRASYGLTGLPPTHAQVNAYLNDESESAWTTLVEELLSSPNYGAHWGRHWLDVVRYADTAGENTDRPLPHAWRYRNWVFDSFNRNLPYDQFVRMQIAGDVVTDGLDENLRQEGIIATGYLAIARRFGHDIDKDLHLTYEDVIDNMGKSFLGLTAGCARCHDHKYDPITSEDYYALLGILSSTQFAFPGCEAKGQPRDMVPLLSVPQTDSLMQPWRDRNAHIEAENAARKAEIEAKKQAFAAMSASARKPLAESQVEEGGRVSLAPSQFPSLNAIQVTKGSVLQLNILPNGNHGADSTLVNWQIYEIGGLDRHWNTDELIDNLTLSNPHPGAESASWCFLESTDGPTFLLEKRSTNGGSGSISSWSIGSEPSVFSNQATEPTVVWTSLAARSLFMHPGPGRPVALAWVSPIDGQVRISGEVADAHPAPGLDGVSFRLEQLLAPELGDALLAIGKASTFEVQSLEPMPEIPVAYAVKEGTPGSARKHVRGDSEKLGEEIPRRWMAIFGGVAVPNDSGSGRRELADWIVRNPLFARVMVNRIWQWHFGHGLVRTPNDFGSRGEFPTHHELLDWLAAQFIASGYDVKSMHRLIMKSQTYQRSCQSSLVAMEQDPLNNFLTHCNRRRLTAEELRDTLLHASGELDLSPGGPHPFPPETKWTYTQHDPFNAVYESNKRSAYLMVQRQRRHPFLALFDGADPNASTPTRQSTTIPTQSLYFLNDAFFHSQATQVATQVKNVEDFDEKVNAVYSRLLQRSPTANEVETCKRFLARYTGTDQERWSAWVRVVMASNEFLFLD